MTVTYFKDEYTTRVYTSRFDELDRVDRVDRRTAPDETYVSIEYNLAGRQTAFVDELGRRTEYEYNAIVGWLEMIHLPDPDTIGETEGTIEYVRSARGEVLMMTNAEGESVETLYDFAGRLIRQIAAADCEAPRRAHPELRARCHASARRSDGLLCQRDARTGSWGPRSSF